jgi:hypothetical protein
LSILGIKLRELGENLSLFYILFVFIHSTTEKTFHSILLFCSMSFFCGCNSFIFILNSSIIWVQFISYLDIFSCFSKVLSILVSYSSNINCFRCFWIKLDSLRSHTNCFFEVICRIQTQWHVLEACNLQFN